MWIRSQARPTAKMPDHDPSVPPGARRPSCVGLALVAVDSWVPEPSASSEAKVAVLHIGTHKTATTSLQSMIAANSAHFVGQGLCYPATGRWGDGHHNLAWELNADERLQASAGKLVDLTAELEAGQPGAVLLSSEDFEYLYRKPDRLAQLREALEALGYRVEVLVALRQPSDYAESLYWELGKHGLQMSLADFTGEILARGGITFRSWDFRLDYQPLVASFARNFGPEAIHVLRYQESEFVGPLLATCGDLLGLSLAAVPGWQRHNQRPASGAGPDPVGMAPPVVRIADRCRLLLTPAERQQIDAAFAGAVDILCCRHPARPSFPVAMTAAARSAER